MKGTGTYTSLVTPKLPKVENSWKEMFGLAYPNDKKKRFLDTAINTMILSGMQRNFFIQKCSLRCTGYSIKLEQPFLSNFTRQEQ